VWATLIGPFVGLAGATPRSERAAIEAAVRQANSDAVWGQALRSGDPAPLAAAWEGDPLHYFSQEVLEFRARGLRLVSTLLELEFLEVALEGSDRARATTRERWLDLTCTEAGELRAERRPEVRVEYRLIRRADGWRVDGVEITLEGGSFDWTPTEDAAEGTSPCAAVVVADGSENGGPR
jgi:hypothetical protein